MNGDDIVCRWSLPISFVYTHAHYTSTPIAAERYCTHIMVACHVVYHARNDTVSHAGEDTKGHYREARRVLRKAPSCHEKLRIPETCHSPPPIVLTCSAPCRLPLHGPLSSLQLRGIHRRPRAGTASQGAWCERMVHGGVQGAWGSVVCMGEYRMHGRVQGARCECRVHGRVQGAWGSVGCIGEYRVHWRVQGAKCKYRVHGRVQRVWESVGCIGECQVAEP